MEFTLSWNNTPHCRIIRDTDGVITILLNKSRFMFHKNDPHANEKFLGVLNVITYGYERGGWDLHLCDGEVLYAVDAINVIHVVSTFVPS